MIIIFLIIIILIFIYFGKEYKKISEYINLILNFKLEKNKESNFITTKKENINSNKKNVKIRKKKKYINKKLSKLNKSKSLSKVSLSILLNSHLETKSNDRKKNNII